MAASIEEKDLQCPICLELPELAVESDCCHQLFCESCIASIRECPTCRNSPLCVKPSIALRRLIGHMTIECELCGSKVERASRVEHSSLCEKNLLKCAAPDCEFQSADREAFANHIASVHREQLVRNYARLFRECECEVTRPPVVQQRFLTRMMAEQRQGLAGQAGYQFFSNQQGMQPLPFSPTGGPAAARFPFQRPQRFPMQMGTRPQMNAPGLMINPLTGLAAGMNAGQMAGHAAGYPALGGLPGAAANGQFGQQLNASFNGRQPNWDPAAMGQRGASGGGPGRPGQMAQAMAQAANAQNQLLSNQHALTGAGGANPFVQNQTTEQQAAALLKAQAAVGINLANAPPALVQQLKQAQQTGLASADAIRFLAQSQNPALAQAPVAAPQQTVATDSTQVELVRQLASAAPSEQKQILGEKLYPLIREMHASLAGKITGMLLEMDNSKLLHMLEAPEVLRSKVSEAFDVLQQHQIAGTQPASATAQPGGLLTTAAKEPGPEA